MHGESLQTRVILQPRLPVTQGSREFWGSEYQVWLAAGLQRTVLTQWFYHQPLPSSRGNHKAHSLVDLYSYQISALYSRPVCSWSSKQNRTVTSITLLTISGQLAGSQSSKMCSLHLMKLCIHRSMPPQPEITFQQVSSLAWPADTEVLTRSSVKACSV